MPDLLFRSNFEVNVVDIFGGFKFQDEIEKKGFDNFNWKQTSNCYNCSFLRFENNFFPINGTICNRNCIRLYDSITATNQLNVADRCSIQ